MSTWACCNRTVPISMEKRSWSNPSFAQTESHPVVCVNHQDAQAYAAWLSERTGQTYRLPTTTEWRLIANFPGSGDACRDGRIDCGGTGTITSDQEPKNPIGLAGIRGNVREWLSECSGSCKRRQVAGPSWRDPPGRADPLRTTGLDADDGFDDVGFRLVREIDSRR